MAKKPVQKRRFAGGGAVPVSPQGLREPGNIDLKTRPIVQHPDGSYSTIKSTSFGTDQGQVVVPTVSDDGRMMTPDEAWQQYQKTGRHLGIVDTIDNANAYAQKLHEDEAKNYENVDGKWRRKQDYANGGIVKRNKMVTKQVRKPGRPAKKTRRTFAGGGAVDNVRQKFDRGAQLAAAENGAMGQPQTQAPAAPAPVDPGMQLSEGERYMLEANRAAEAAAMQAQKPGWKKMLGFAGGGVVRMAQGDRVPDPEEAMRQIGANNYGGYGPSPAAPSRTLADAAVDAAGSAVQGARGAWNAGADAVSRGVNAAMPAVGRAADKAKAFAQEAWGVSPVRDAAAAVGGWADQYNRNAFGPSAAPVARAAPAPAPVSAETRRPGGTIGRLGRTPSVPTDADFWPQAAPVQAPAPARGAVPPSAPNNAYGTQEEILGAAAQGLKAQRAADAVSPERVAGARRQAQFEERNIARDRGQGMIGGPLAAQQATADNALLQQWYSLKPEERGRMPVSVENAMYRGADDTETAFNVARQRIMQAPLRPDQQAQALANLDKTRGEMLNQAQQTRQTGENQRGMLANEQQRTGIFQQQADQTGQNQQAEMAHKQRLAQLTLEQASAEGALLPEPVYVPERGTEAGYNENFDKYQQNYLRARRLVTSRLMQGETLQEIIKSPGSEEDRALLAMVINPTATMRPKQYAGGGMVSPQAPVYGGAPDAQRADPLINAYRVYTTQSKAMGAPTVPFAEFSSLYAGATQGPMQPPVGMAGGGAVPAAGKMVIDTDPDAEEDSIPAMIDGEQPAALNSGEFVFPTDVTSYYGTKMLSGMIAEARQGAQSGAGEERGV